MCLLLLSWWWRSIWVINVPSLHNGSVWQLMTIGMKDYEKLKMTRLRTVLKRGVLFRRQPMTSRWRAMWTDWYPHTLIQHVVLVWSKDWLSVGLWANKHNTRADVFQITHDLVTVPDCHCFPAIIPVFICTPSCFILAEEEKQLHHLFAWMPKCDMYLCEADKYLKQQCELWIVCVNSKGRRSNTLLYSHKNWS